MGEIDARLRALRLPPLRAPASELPRPRIAFLWIPLSFGNPELARNHPRHWWPGGAWVDWVGSTWYSPHPNARAFERFARHRLWRRKPFAFAEYGVWGAERPSFIRSFFRFARSHPRVRMVVYFQSSLMKPEFRLSTHPRSRAELRRQLRARRYAAFAPEYR